MDAERQAAARERRAADAAQTKVRRANRRNENLRWWAIRLGIVLAVIGIILVIRALAG